MIFFSIIYSFIYILLLQKKWLSSFRIYKVFKSLWCISPLFGPNSISISSLNSHSTSIISWFMNFANICWHTALKVEVFTHCIPTFHRCPFYSCVAVGSLFYCTLLEDKHCIRLLSFCPFLFHFLSDMYFLSYWKTQHYLLSYFEPNEYFSTFTPD